MNDKTKPQISQSIRTNGRDGDRTIFGAAFCSPSGLEKGACTHLVENTAARKGGCFSATSQSFGTTDSKLTAPFMVQLFAALTGRKKVPARTCIESVSTRKQREGRRSSESLFFHSWSFGTADFGCCTHPRKVGQTMKTPAGGNTEGRFGGRDKGVSPSHNHKISESYRTAGPIRYTTNLWGTFPGTPPLGAQPLGAQPVGILHLGAPGATTENIENKRGMAQLHTFGAGNNTGGKNCCAGGIDK